ncbi:MAG: hypothetical protein M1815_004208 [Lichina confinis]|nr:MAG: hypothetical protein M1815_004208 [Lichina confinis]
MPKIASIEYFRVCPRWLFVKICDAEGFSGWGEATLEGHTEAVEGTLNALIKRFVGYDADDIEHLWQTAWRLGFYRGGPVLMSAISGIDIALWDMKGMVARLRPPPHADRFDGRSPEGPAGSGLSRSNVVGFCRVGFCSFDVISVASKDAREAALSDSRRLGVPIYQLLGGRVRNKLAVYAWIGGDRPKDVANAAKIRKAQGFRTVKMNATADVDWLDSPAALDSSVERLAVVKALGLEVAVDFHGRLHKPMAKQLAKALEPHKPLFIEEPLLSEHSEGIKQLSDLTTCPIALGERLYSRWDVKRFLQDASVDVLQPDISHVGGISEIRRIASMAEAYDVSIAPHCPLGPIALAASMQVAVATPNFVIQEMSMGIHYNTEAGDYDLASYLKDPSVFEVEDGYVKAPTGVGLGIDVDEAEVRKVAATAQPWLPKEFYGADGGIREW